MFLPAPDLLVAACAVTLFAGFVKGAVGFAMPMLMISGLGSFLPAEQALAALIIPTFLTNGVQALRQGVTEALATAQRFRRFLLVGLICLLTTAQLYAFVPSAVMFMLIGVPIVLFCVLQLRGWRPRIVPRYRSQAELWAGMLAGLSGGLSGVWGPPTVAYLSAIETPKGDQMRIQGVAYGLGAAALAVAHLRSGVFSEQTAPLSLLLVGPAVAGMWLGVRFHDRLDQASFRRMTLLVLLLAGVNLIRKGLMG